MVKCLKLIGVAVFTVLAAVTTASAQPSSGLIRQFEDRCATCHRNPGAPVVAGGESAPDVAALQKMTPDALYRALSTSTTPPHTQNVTDDQKRAYAEFLGASRKLVPAGTADAKAMPNQCPANASFPDPKAGSSWNGWSADLGNTRFQPAKAAGLTASDVPQLKLKWAFGLPGSASMYSQPTVVSGRVFIAADTGYVYSLDANTGCVYWSFDAGSGVRNALSVGPVTGHGTTKYAVNFGDSRANLYSLDAATGALLWKVNIESHPLAVITGAPTLYQGRLYVPTSSREEAAGSSPNYPCCTFRGSITAVDASTGKQAWRYYIVPDAPKPTKKNSKGVQQWAPAGGAVWSSPTIDPARGLLYIATGDGYTEPAPKTTDAIVALDLETGKIRWSSQDTPGDAWLGGCDGQTPTENCPEDVGPDYDFGSSAMMKRLSNEQTILVAGQKSGEVYGHDVNKNGAVIWKATLVDKLARGEIVFGGAADDRQAYFGTRTGGITALDLATGTKKWYAALEPPSGNARRSQTGALTVIPGVLFAGGGDGVVRALATEDGKVLWQYDTTKSVPTVNKVAAKGGPMGAPGPTVVDGTVFVASGYTGLGGGMAGNVLLAFSAK